MAVVSLRTLATILVAIIAASGLLLVAGTWWVADRIAESQNEWRAYRSANSPSAIALVDIGTNLGYGGVVHHLKNYVLRGDPAYVERFRTSIGGVRAALDRYRTTSPGDREVAALDAIERSIGELERVAAATRAMTADGSKPHEIHAALPLDLGPALRALAVLENAVHTRRSAEGKRQSKLEVLYDLRRAIGFGGMIHAFKDLVLSRDASLVDEVLASIRRAEARIEEYRAIGITEQETAALSGIQSVMDEYAEKSTLVASMISEGADSKVIDDVAKVDDGPALSAFGMLELTIVAEAGRRARRIDSTLGFVAELSGSLVATAIAVGIAVCVFVAWVLLRAVQQPLTRIAADMNRLAEGDIAGTTRMRSRIAEVSALADAAEVFKGHAEELALHAVSLQRFQRLSTDASLPLDQRISDILAFGLAHFGLTLGNVSRTDGGTYVVEHSVGTGEQARRAGDSFDLDTTYCWHMLEAGHAWAVHDIADSELADAVCFRMFGRHAYIGAPINVEGAIFGTVNFSSVEPRARPFTDGDLALIELIARWLGMELERERALHRLATAKAEAEDAARTKAEFLANMSHEIRTPMNAVIGLTGLALRSDLPDRTRDYLEKIKRSSMTLLRIINDILDFSKIEAGRLSIEATPFDLDDVLQDVAMLIGELQEGKPVEVVFSSDPDIPRTLIGDPLRLGQIFVNLVGNAIKFTQAGEIVVRISAAGREDDRLRLQASVTDTGIGMSEEQVARLFRAFSQADGSTTRRFGGTGLGLAICKQLVGLMGGEISVESKLGEGSIFSFTVLVGDPGGQQKRELPRHVDAAKVRFLVVEDNAVARAVLLDTLQGLRFKDVEAAPDGPAAVLAFRDALRRGEPFDVVLVDWRMPDMDGIETARRLHELSEPDASPPILLMTAHTRAEVVELAQDAPIFKVLFKPLNVSMLVDGIAEALDAVRGRRIVAEPPQSQPVTGKSRLAGLHVLVVEDNEINQQIAKELLEDAGVGVTIAETGAAALTYLRESETLPDAVLMDLQMPELDGYEATRWIRADDRFTHLPVIAMTAHVTAEERARCLAAGMVDHIAKPVEVRQLLNTLARWTRPGTADEADNSDPYFSVGDDAAGGADSVPAASRAVLDIEGARARLGVPMPVLERAVKQFSQGYRDALAVLAAHLADGDRKAAERYAHSVVGLAATIGANALSAEARVIEAALRDPGRVEPPDLSVLERVHREVFETIDGLALSDAPEVDAAVTQGDPARLGALIREMDVGLATNRISIRRRFDELRSVCDKAAGRELDQLAADLGRLDFPSARGHLRAIAALHAIDLEAADD